MIHTGLQIPSPQDLGFDPDKFPGWRKNQPQAIEDGLRAGKRFIGQVQKQGSGKSLTGMAQAVLSESRTMFLTATKGLQSQLVDDFEKNGLACIMGRANYRCSWDSTQNCEDGGIGKCGYKGSTLCEFTAAKQAVLDSQFATTNYSFWMAANKYGIDLGSFDILFCDEAHNIQEELNKAMQIQISDHEVVQMLKWQWPDPRDIADQSDCMDHWKVWATNAHKRAKLMLEDITEQMEENDHPSATVVEKFKHQRNLVRKLDDIARCRPSNWVADTWDHGWQFDPTDASEYAERLLWHGIPRVILTSGTIRPRTMDILRIPESDYNFFEYESEFKADKSPFVYVPIAKIDRGSSEEDYEKLVNAIDDTIDLWSDYKGLIHTSSFELRDRIWEASRNRRYLVTNEEGETIMEAIARFKAMKPPAAFISPSITTGFDFKHDEARYQIIAKIPFPSSLSKVEQRRCKLDPKRGGYIAMQKLVQAYGRADRADDDWQVCMCFDRNWEWFRWKYQDLAPVWFPAYVRRSSMIPGPPEFDIR